MKFFKYFAKKVSIMLLSTLLVTTLVYADEVKVPNIGTYAKEYSNMVYKASVFESLQDVAVDTFSNKCISQATMDKAIESAKLAANEIKNLSFLRSDNLRYIGPYSYNKKTDKDYFPVPTKGTEVIPCVRDNGVIIAVKEHLKKASVGEVSIQIKTKASADFKEVRVTDEYFESVYLSISHDLIGISNDKYILNFNKKDSEGFYTIDKISSIISDYADFLSYLKTFYAAAGCYDENNTKKANSNKTNNVDVEDVKEGKSSNNISDAVIVANDRTIKAGQVFNFMQGVKAVDDGGEGDVITNKISVSGKINTAVPSTYIITYKVKGESGNVIYKDVEITVEK